MKRRVSALVALVFSSTSVAARAPLTPTAGWVVNFADAQCIASRNYGTAINPLLLVLKQPALGDVLQVAIVEKGASDIIPRQMEGEIIFDQHAPLAVSLLQFGVKHGNQTVLTANLPKDRLSLMRAASTIRVRARDTQEAIIHPGSRVVEATAAQADYTLKLTQIPALLGLLDNCAIDLAKVWHVEDDDAKPTLVQKQPSGELKVFSSDDYPDIALLKNQQGSITVAVLVDENGKVSDCTVIKTSGVASLDAQTCVVIQQRAKLKPAVGLDGKPAKGALTQTISWKIAG